MGTTNVKKREGNLQMPREQQFSIALNQLMDLYNDVPLVQRCAILNFTSMDSLTENGAYNEEDAMRSLFVMVFMKFQKKYKGLELKGTLVYLNGECKFNIEGYNLLRNLTSLCDIIQYELK